MSETQNEGRAALRNPNFQRYLLMRLLTTSASEMQSVAVGWQLYEITHRPLDLGLAGLAQFLPPICLFLLAGQAADRWPRQRILQICGLGFALCSALLLLFAFQRIHSPLPVYGALLLNGTVRAFNAPAAQSFLPLILPREQFSRAVAWNSSAFQVATIAGPMLGGLLYGLTGSPKLVYGWAFVACLLGVVALSRIRLTGAPLDAATVRRTGMVLAGLQYIWQNKLLLGAISLDLFAVLLGGAVALLPVYAREILHVGASGLGIMRSAPGIGAVLTSITIAHRPLRRRAGRAMLWGVAGFGLLTVVFGLSRNFAVSLIALLLLGATDTISVIVRSTMIQLNTPDEMRGRVSAVNMVFIGASNEVGQFESGITAQWLGTVPAVVAGGIGTLLIVAGWAWLFPQLRQLDRMDGSKNPLT